MVVIQKLLREFKFIFKKSILKYLRAIGLKKAKVVGL